VHAASWWTRVHDDRFTLPEKRISGIQFKTGHWDDRPVQQMLFQLLN